MSGNEGDITGGTALEQRSYGKMILFFVLSLGFDGLYWMHQVHKQYQKEFGKEYDPTLRTLGLFVPFYNLVVVWKLCQLSENVVDDQDGTILFILWILVAPIAVYLIQSGINSKVEDAV